MAHVTTLRPFGFSQPVRVAPKPKRRAETPIPSDDLTRTVHPPNGPSSPHKHKSRRVSLPADSLGPYWATPPPYQPRAAALKSGLSQRPFPDEEDDDDVIPPARHPHSRTHDKRRPPRIQTSGRARRPSAGSPVTPTALHKLTGLQLHSPGGGDLPAGAAARSDFTERQLQQQLKQIYAALRSVEDEREQVLSQMHAGRADRQMLERELEMTRRENERLAARLEEMLKSSKTKSPLSARSDDAWGCSMYDIEG